jgi:hypothetical protein
MDYLVARASGLNNRDITFQQLGCTSKNEVHPERTKFTGLFDVDGNPIHKRAGAPQAMGFHKAR